MTGLNYSVPKPVETQEECDAYAAMAQAVNEHNWACKAGDTLWKVEDGETAYTVVEGETVPEPGDPEPTIKEQLAALKSENVTLKKESETLKQCLLEMSETVYA